MSLRFTPHILPLTGTALLALILLRGAWKNRRDPVAFWFGATLVTLVVWSVGYALEIMAVGLQATIFFANLQFIGVPTIIVCWWEMIRRYVGMGSLPRWSTAAIWAVPVLTVIVAFVNPGGLFRVAPSLVMGSAPFPVLHADYGPWYWWVLMPTMTLLSIATLSLLVRAFVRSHGFYRNQYVVLILALLLPLTGNFLYVFGLLAWGDYNPAPSLLGVSCLLVAMGLFRCRLFSMVPLARDKVVDDLADPVVVVDALGRLVDFNRAAERVLGLNRRESIALPAGETLAVYPRLSELLRASDGDGAEERDAADMALSVGDEQRHFALACSSVTGRRGDHLGKVLVMHDVSERVRLLERTRELANQDDLTALPNRRHFLELSARECERSLRHNIPLSFLLMDVDHFKNVNDSFGHRAGDRLLRELSDACRGALRTSDIIGRVGGEEFGILLPETGLEDAIEVAGRVREVVQALQVASNRAEVPIAVTVSMGLVQLQQAAPGAERDSFLGLYERADRALYAAKRSGRNMVVAGGDAAGRLAVV